MLTGRILVIGGGFGGPASAVRLAASGHKVKLSEARDQLGGRGYVYRRNGFTFDGGPTVIAAPFLFDELFALAGHQRERLDYDVHRPRAHASDLRKLVLLPGVLATIARLKAPDRSLGSSGPGGHRPAPTAA